MLILLCTVGICEPLSTMKSRGTTVTKDIGENFNLRCPSYSCSQYAAGIYKLNETTEELEYIKQGHFFNKVITDYDDAGIYCCVSQYANITESCCIHVTGMHCYYKLCIYVIITYGSYVYKFYVFIY